ncbi:hypothetical protein ACLIA0_14485 [Bacillaceae bacterium W0354]
MQSRIYQLEHLLANIPSIGYKQGYIEAFKEDEMQTSLLIKFAVMEKDNEAPNGFVIKEKESEYVEAANNIEIFFLEGTELHNLKSIDELESKVNEHDRLFNIYLVNNKIIMLSEQYVP